MTNFVKQGGVIDFYNASTAILSGDVVVMAGLIGIAVTNIANLGTGSVNLEGVYELPSNVAIPAIGTPMYFNASTKEVDTDATVGPFIGNCAASVADLADHVRVLLPGEGRPAGAAITAQTHIAHVTPSNLTAVPGSFADVAAVRTYLLTLVSDIETRLDAIDTLENALLTKLESAGILAAS